MNDKLQQLKKSYLDTLQKNKTTIVGIGVTAFNRIGPAFFYPGYQIICYKDSSDIDQLKQYTTIKSIQMDFEKFGDISKLNTLSILKHQGVQHYLTSLPEKVGIFVYRTTKEVDKLCHQLGFDILANPSAIRDQYEHKREFFQLGRKIGLPMIPGEQWQIDQLGAKEYQQLKIKLGTKLVFQLTEFNRGGGKGTFFVNTIKDFRRFHQVVSQLRQEKDFVFVNVTKFIQGPSPSITGCATRHGVLTGIVQTQVLDIPQLKKSPNQGVFIGHDWSYHHYSSTIQNQADKIAQTLGKYMYQHGYKGIFGVDLVIDQATDTVYPVECNPRYTAAFPVYTMMQLEYGEIPLDIFQLLEFLNLDYDCDLNAVNQSWKQPKLGAHLVLYNLYPDQWVKAQGNLPAGVYVLRQGHLQHLRPGVTYQDIKTKDEFVLTDGCPRSGQLVKPNLRTGKLIFKRQVLKKPGQLVDFASEVVDQTLKAFNFKPINTSLHQSSS